MEEKDIIKKDKNTYDTKEDTLDDKFSSKTLLNLWIKDTLKKKEEQKNQI